MARLRVLEAKHDLFQYQVDGYSAWRLLRFAAASKMQNLPFVVKPAGTIFRELFERLVLVLPELIKILFPRRAEFVIKTCSSALREQTNGFYKDVYFDDLIGELGSCYKIETINNPAYSGRRKSALIPIALTTSTIEVISYLLAWVQSMRISKEAAQISQILQANAPLPAFTPRYIERIFRKFRWHKRIFVFLLRRIRPKHVLVANTGEYAIWAAAQELGITTIEFQHGIFTQNHPDALPALAATYRKNMIVPQKILLYGEYWKADLEKNQFYLQELVPVGNPHIDRYRKIRAGYLAGRKPDCPCLILLTTQGLDRERLIGFVSDFLKAAQGKLDYSLYIKLHPIYDREKSSYERAFGSDPKVRILLGSESPTTLELLAKADFHVSIASATHYEALGLGVPTIILPFAGHEIVLPLTDAGHARLAHTSRDLLDILRGQRGISVPPEVSNFYFTPNSMDITKRELGIPL